MWRSIRPATLKQPSDNSSPTATLTVIPAISDSVADNYRDCRSCSSRRRACRRRLDSIGIIFWSAAGSAKHISEFGTPSGVTGRDSHSLGPWSKSDVDGSQTTRSVHTEQRCLVEPCCTFSAVGLKRLQPLTASGEPDKIATCSERLGRIVVVVRHTTLTTRWAVNKTQMQLELPSAASVSSA